MVVVNGSTKNLLKKRVRDTPSDFQKKMNGAGHLVDSSERFCGHDIVPPMRKRACIAVSVSSLPAELREHPYCSNPVPIVNNHGSDDGSDDGRHSTTEEIIEEILGIDGDDTFAGLHDLMPLIPADMMHQQRQENRIVRGRGSAPETAPPKSEMLRLSDNEERSSSSESSDSGKATTKKLAKSKRTKEESKASHRLIERRRTKRLNDLLGRLKGEIQRSGLRVRKDKASVLESAIDCIKNMRVSLKQVTNRLNLANMRERSYFLSQEMCLKGMVGQQQQRNQAMFMRTPMGMMYPSVGLGIQSRSQIGYPPLVPRPKIAKVLPRSVASK